MVERTRLHICGNFCYSWHGYGSLDPPPFPERDLETWHTIQPAFVKDVLSTRTALWGAKSGKKEVEVEVEKVCDEGNVLHLPLYVSTEAGGV